MVKSVPGIKRDAAPQNKKTSLNRSEEIKAAGAKTIVIGIDEAGRGPLCGPVVAAACIISDTDGPDIDGIIDSKKLTNEKDREEVYENLVSDQRVMWCTSIVSNTEIDTINILQASLAAMKRATEGLISKYNLNNLSSCIALIDGNKIPEEMPVFSKYIIKGDGHIFSIAAASIIAKVTRDRIMIKLDKEYPVYGLARHKGYPTLEHRTALYEHGPTCDIYRMTYAPVKLAAIRQEELASKRSNSNNPNCKKSNGLSTSIKDAKGTSIVAIRKVTKKVKKSMNKIIAKVKIEKIKSIRKPSKAHGSLNITTDVVKEIPMRRSERLKLIL